MKLFSIIIPCHNSSLYLDDCFDSVTKQTIGINNLEVIFVNDASTDNTGEILNQYESLYPESVITIHLSENIKQGGARNVGLQYATGEYIVFLDSDDWLDVAFLEIIYNIIHTQDIDILQFPFVNVLFKNEEVIQQQNPVYWQGLRLLDTHDARKDFLIHQHFNCGSQCKVYKTDLIRNTGAAFLTGVAYEEPSFVYPLFFHAKRIYSFEKGMYFCRQHEASTMKSYITKPGKLYDHPYVQLSVYKQMRAQYELYSLYKEEIDFYFLFTFYIETIIFSKIGNLYLGYDFFLLMQDTVKSMLPKWKENSYINSFLTPNQFRILSSVEETLTYESFPNFLKEIE